MFPLNFWSESTVMPPASAPLCGSRSSYTPHPSFLSHSVSVPHSLPTPASLQLGLPTQLAASFWRQIAASANSDVHPPSSLMTSFPVPPFPESELSKSTAVAQHMLDLRHHYNGKLTAEYQLQMLRQLLPITCSPPPVQPPRSDSRTTAATDIVLNRKLNDDVRSFNNSPSPTAAAANDAHLSGRVIRSPLGQQQHEAGMKLIQCPVCGEKLSRWQIATHLVDEFAQLQQDEMAKIKCRDSLAADDSLLLKQNDKPVRNVSSRSRYETFVRIRNNRESRITKLRYERLRLRRPGPVLRPSTGADRTSRDRHLLEIDLVTSRENCGRSDRLTASSSASTSSSTQNGAHSDYDDDVTEELHNSDDEMIDVIGLDLDLERESRGHQDVKHLSNERRNRAPTEYDSTQQRLPSTDDGHRMTSPDGSQLNSSDSQRAETEADG